MLKLQSSKSKNTNYETYCQNAIMDLENNTPNFEVLSTKEKSIKKVLSEYIKPKILDIWKKCEAILIPGSLYIFYENNKELIDS